MAKDNRCPHHWQPVIYKLVEQPAEPMATMSYRAAPQLHCGSNRRTTAAFSCMAAKARLGSCSTAGPMPTALSGPVKRSGLPGGAAQGHHGPSSSMHAGRFSFTGSSLHGQHAPVQIMQTAKLRRDVSAAAVVSLSPAAQQCMLQARVEAQHMASTEVQPGHVLLGCLRLGAAVRGGQDTETMARREPQDALNNELEACSQLAAVFQEAGVTVDHAAALLTDAMKEGSSSIGTQPAPSTPPPRVSSSAAPAGERKPPQLSSLTHLVITDALLIAEDQGHTSIKPGHLLLAVLRMAPLPTVLYNPLTWMMNRVPGLSRALSYQLEHKVHKVLFIAAEALRKQGMGSSCTEEELLHSTLLKHGRAELALSHAVVGHEWEHAERLLAKVWQDTSAGVAEARRRTGLHFPPLLYSPVQRVLALDLSLVPRYLAASLAVLAMRRAWQDWAAHGVIDGDAVAAARRVAEWANSVKASYVASPDSITWPTAVCLATVAGADAYALQAAHNPLQAQEQLRCGKQLLQGTHAVVPASPGQVLLAWARLHAACGDWKGVMKACTTIPTTPSSSDSTAGFSLWITALPVSVIDPWALQKAGSRILRAAKAMGLRASQQASLLQQLAFTIIRVGFVRQDAAHHQQPGRQQQQPLELPKWVKQENALHDRLALAALAALVQGWQGEEEQAALQTVLGPYAPQLLMDAELVEYSYQGSPVQLSSVRFLDLTQQMQQIHDAIQSQEMDRRNAAPHTAAGSSAHVSGGMPLASQQAALYALIE